MHSWDSKVSFSKINNFETDPEKVHDVGELIDLSFFSVVFKLLKDSGLKFSQGIIMQH